MAEKVIIGSRGSELALWQAHFVIGQLKSLGVETELKIISTKGDQIQHLSFDKMEGKGFFTKEIEEALLKKEIDLAVHSHKDLETSQPDGLTIAAVSDREDPSELLLIHPNAYDEKEEFFLKKCALVGTSSARRKSQLLMFRSDVKLKDLRGNVPTRVKKLRDGEYDAILLAAAGVNRLNLDLSGLKAVKLDPKKFISAPAQGVLGLQIRKEDTSLAAVLSKLNHKETQQRISIERKILNLFQGGCQLPLGAYCEKENITFKVWACVADSWDAIPKRFYGQFPDSLHTDEIASQIVEALKKNASRSVFISRELSAGSIFQKLLTSHKYAVEGKSLIKLEKNEEIIFPDSDWVFFNSSNAVSFLDSEIIESLKSRKIAAMGDSTAKALREKNLSPAFVGDGTSPEKIAVDFSKKAQGESVLFPCSDQSNKSIQKNLKTDVICQEVALYKTIESPVPISKKDLYVFTSPKNVDSFFKLNEFEKDASFIAIGETTKKALEKHGISKIFVPWESSEIALADLILSL